MIIRFLDLRTVGEGDLSRWRGWLPEERRAEIDGMAQPMPHLCGEGLVREMLAKKLGVAPEEIEITRNPHGKPLVEGAHFSLSHSGDWAVCAVDDEAVGIDLERMRERVPEQLSRRLGTDDPAEFCVRWTAMEARVKCVGSTVFHWQEFLEDAQGLSTERVEAPEGYRCSVCRKR